MLGSFTIVIIIMGKHLLQSFLKREIKIPPFHFPRFAIPNRPKILILAFFFHPAIFHL